MPRIGEIFWTFLRLGLIAFGGPVAHLGYFRRWFVEERRWLTDDAYAQSVALCQMLPGPSSSQTGFAIGIHRGGLVGGIAAWVAFTLPSALIMIAIGMGVTTLDGFADAGWLQGLKLAAVAVVANALYGMARQLCPDPPRIGIAVAATLGAGLLPGMGGQVAMIALGGLTAIAFLDAPKQTPGTLHIGISRRQGLIALGVFTAGLLVLMLPLPGMPALWGVLYRSGALVFGGGHVVLPLLETGLVAPGLIDGDRFLAGYGAAQAIPGPIFTFGGYLGAQIMPGHALWAGLLAIVMIFLPGMLLVVGLLPFWSALGRFQRVRQALLGINAAVVGLIAAVLWDPILIKGIGGPMDGLIALLALAALALLRLPAWAVVAACALVGELITRLPAVG
ncbi:chromate efflux transporter [Spiribacter onubensis]|uniref:Chromate efflux transporter n=1 Tax=Spiribacter onubensis TaxID=3122420 RepID=A0ABV3S8H6_9GAMM